MPHTSPDELLDELDELKRPGGAGERAAQGAATSAAKRANSPLENFSLLLALVPALRRWSEDEKRALVRLIRAKAGADELTYLRLLGKHRRLRREFLRLGSEKQQVEGRKQ